MTSYLQNPFAADRISTVAVGRYQHLAEAIRDLGRTVTEGARPRTRNSRHEIADLFDEESAEIQALGSTLESSLAELVEEPQSSPGLSETGSRESDFSGSRVRETFAGGNP
jgi:hypothetical protein